MTRIGGGSKPPSGPPKPVTEAAAQKAGAESGKTGDAAKTGGAKATKDGFEMKGASLASRLQSLQGQKMAGKLQFSNADLADLVRAFGAVLKQNQGADRKKRAELFSKAVLKKKKKFAKLLESASEEDVENFFEAIAEQLESSPVFAQLLDDVSEESIKYSGG
jgi:hypothetical protein